MAHEYGTKQWAMHGVWAIVLASTNLCVGSDTALHAGEARGVEGFPSRGVPGSAPADVVWKDQLVVLLQWLCGFLNCHGATSLSTMDFEGEVEAFVRMADGADVPEDRTGSERALAAMQIESARLITVAHAGEMPGELAWSLERTLGELDALLASPATTERGAP